MEKVSYRSYPLLRPLVVNGRKFTVLTISSHYEKNHGSYMNDETIKEIVQQLDNKKGFVPKLRGSLPDNPNEHWQSFCEEPLFYNGKAYRLIWYWESNKKEIWVLNCFRRKKYE